MAVGPDVFDLRARVRPVNRQSRLAFDPDMFDQPVDDVRWPSSLEYLRFGYSFNRPIDKVSWPRSTKYFGLGVGFEQPIESVYVASVTAGPSVAYQTESWNDPLPEISGVRVIKYVRDLPFPVVWSPGVFE